MGTKEFFAKRIDEEIFQRIKGLSYREDCTVPVDELRYIHVLHRDLNGEIRQGELISSVYIVRDLLEIFRQLYEAEYPIEKIRLADEYGADDEASMTDNNSSCFNFRFISHTRQVSKHGLGLAVDINPLYNPYVKQVEGRLSVEPAAGTPYLDRSREFPCKITEEDLCCRLFLRHGFEWGGSWEDRKDYQHFEIPDKMVKQLFS